MTGCDSDGEGISDDAEDEDSRGFYGFGAEDIDEVEGKESVRKTNSPCFHIVALSVLSMLLTLFGTANTNPCFSNFFFLFNPTLTKLAL